MRKHLANQFWTHESHWYHCELPAKRRTKAFRMLPNDASLEAKSALPSRRLKHGLPGYDAGREGKKKLPPRFCWQLGAEKSHRLLFFKCFFLVFRQIPLMPGTGFMSLLLMGGGCRMGLGARVRQTGKPAAHIKMPVIPREGKRESNWNMEDEDKQPINKAAGMLHPRGTLTKFTG